MIRIAATSPESLLHSAAAMGTCARLSADRQPTKVYPTFGSWTINPEVGE